MVFTFTMSEEVKIDKDLYSRQLYVLGESAMRKMAQANVFISGLSGVGVEIGMNYFICTEFSLGKPKTSPWPV